jgi:hypothetical protein
MALITENLVSWQFQHYPEGHTDRRNLTIHLITVPLLWLVTLEVIAGVIQGRWLSPVSWLVMFAIAVVLQGRGHKLEHNPPLPFQSKLDVIVRLLTEQYVTFPRYLLSGGFARAWRATRSS